MAPDTPSPTSPSDDDAALAALRNGDEDAFRTLVRAHHGGLVRMARSFVKTDAVAEEVAQETWAAVLEGLDRFEGRSSVRTWIYRILVKRAISRAEKEGRSVPFSSLSDEPSDLVDPARFTVKGHWKSKGTAPRRWDDGTPEKLALEAESRDVINEAIDSLPPNQRAVITLRDLAGWDSREVCNVLDVSETNQRVLLHRARSKVRSALEAYLDGEAAR